MALGVKRPDWTGLPNTSSEVKQAMHGSSIVATSAWKTKSEGHATEWQKDQKRVTSWRRECGKSLGYPMTSQRYLGSSGCHAQERVRESS